LTARKVGRRKEEKRDGGKKMAVVTISRQFGAGGWTLGEKLSRRFGFHLVDKTVIDEIARRQKISRGWLDAIEKEAGSSILGMISGIVSSGIFYKGPGLEDQGIERKKYVDFLARIMKPMADKGGYIIIGRGAQFILRGHPKALHVMLIGEFEKRASFLMDHYKISRSDAEKMIRERERQRAALASKMFDEDIDDLSLYDIVLNTCRVSFDWAVETVSSLLDSKIREEAVGPVSTIRSSPR
jgi:cytidylate kinase